MALEDIFGVAGSALNAQTTRMNTTASNLANAATVAGSEEVRRPRSRFKSAAKRFPSGPHAKLCARCEQGA